jgi:hypothetical protein
VAAADGLGDLAPDDLEVAEGVAFELGAGDGAAAEDAGGEGRAPDPGSVTGLLLLFRYFVGNAVTWPLREPM